MQKKMTGTLRLWLAYRARCKAGPLMAQAAYEPLSPHDKQNLEQTTRAFPELAEDSAAFARLAKTIRLSEDTLTTDLLPHLRNQLRETPETSPASVKAGAWVAVAAVVLLAIGLYVGVMLFDDMGAAREDGAHHAAAVSLPESLQPPKTVLARTVDEACRLVAASDAERAVATIERAIAKYPDDPFVGEAQLILADIEYTYLQRYNRAHAAYEKLIADYPEVFASSGDSVTRYALLNAACHDEDYASLYTLYNASSSQPEKAFSVYEKLVAHYPGTAVALVALDGMRDVLAQGRTEGAKTMAENLERVRSRCTDPVARAQVDLALGDIYSQKLNDRERALVYYRQAAESDHIALVHQARQALTRME